MHLFRYMFIFSLIMLTGCTSSVVNLRLNAASQLNTDAHHHSLPVQVYIYQLKHSQGFTQASFRNLWHNDASILGRSLVDKQTVTVVPGSTNIVRVELDPTANYIGIMAIFRHPTSGRWRTIHPIPNTIPLWTRTLDVNLHRNVVWIN